MRYRLKDGKRPSERMEVSLVLIDTFQQLRMKHHRDLVAQLPPHWAREMANEVIQVMREREAESC